MIRENYEIHLAPLQGYTDSVFRNAFNKYFGGISVYYTPFIRIERGRFRNRDLRDIQPEHNSVSCLVPQILPGTPEEFRLLADEVQKKGYRKIDINLGCPFPPITGKRRGAGMLPFPEQVKEVLGTIEEYPELQFSVKMRLGLENVSECIYLLDIINNLRLCHVTIHARTGKQQYKGETHPEAFREFYQGCKHPLFYNGDLKTLEDVCRILEKLPLLRGISLGRGLVSSPYVAKEFKENVTLSENERISILFQFHEELFKTYSGLLQGESQLLMKMKTLWEYFYPEADHKHLKRIRKSAKLTQYSECVRNIFNT